jgi:hypothetical protein
MRHRISQSCRTVDPERDAALLELDRLLDGRPGRLRRRAAGALPKPEDG